MNTIMASNTTIVYYKKNIPNIIISRGLCIINAFSNKIHGWRKLLVQVVSITELPWSLLHYYSKETVLLENDTKII